MPTDASKLLLELLEKARPPRVTKLRRKLSIRPQTGLKAMVLAGFLLPFAIRATAEMFFHTKSLLSLVLISPAMAAATDQGLVGLAVLNSLPFAAMAWGYGRFPGRLGGPGVAGAAAMGFFLSAAIHWEIWTLLLGSNPVPSKAVLALVFLPVYISLLMPVGYLCGWAAGRWYSSAVPFHGPSQHRN